MAEVDMNIDFNNNIPIYLQVIDHIKASIISGKIKSGEKLASVRDLAIEFKVNPNTMQKSLAELEQIGLIYTERTNGKYVTNDKKIIENIRREYASNIVSEFYEKMNKIGIENDDAIEYLKRKE